MFTSLREIKPVRPFHLGKPFPLGSTITRRGVNFSVAAPTASRLELLLFANANDNHPEEIIELTDLHKSGDYWHIEIEGLSAGCCYGYRVFGPTDNEAEKFFPEKVLIDPCARSISGWDIYNRHASSNNLSNIDACLKGVVCEREQFDFETHPRPRHPWHKTIIYELHLGGFTNPPESGLEISERGTFLGLIKKLPYLHHLGVTTIELLPVFCFDPSDAPSGLENYWGYSPLNWFTPHPNYLVGNDPLQARQQVRDLVAACHDHEIEVLLDVVYNHTTEGNHNGPTISWKGFGESLYYHQNNEGEYLDVTGCGNSIAANRPLVRKLILESLLCWSTELGIDGFRFDLGIALSRGEKLVPLDSPPLFEEIEGNPALSDLKLISEPWDCDGLYRIADFPAKRVCTWNGCFRDDIRKFWKGDKYSTWPLKDRLIGSPSLYKDNQTSPQRSVNFITSHDGFTLNDLVSFNCKHNLANGENNRDGENHNNSWNHGIEGPSSDKTLNILRSRQQRNLLSTLLLSPGIPMLLMGDELSRSKGGNNNTWCQNNPLGWMVWDENHCDLRLHEFVRKLLVIRKRLPELFSPSIPPAEIIKNADNPKKEFWLEWHGVKLKQPDWSDWSHTISYSLNKDSSGSVMWMGLNAYSKSMIFELPHSTSSWELILDTACPNSEDVPIQPIVITQNKICLESRSLVVVLSNEYASKLSN